MNKNKKNFCIAPFINFHWENQKYGPCCRSVFSKFDKSKSLKENFNSKEMINLRASFLSGEKPKECSLCWKDEEGGKTSYRQYINVGKYWDHDTLDGKLKNSKLVEKGFDYFSTVRLDNLTPTSLALFPGNQCNLSCRMCSGSLSSKWNSETKKHGETKTIRLLDNWQLDDESFDKIVDASDKITRLEIYGGEPLYNKKIKEKLDVLIEKGTAKNIVVYINTNATDVDRKWFKNLSQHFKRIQVSCSVDGTDNHNNYIRHGSNFSQIMENIDFIRGLDNVVFGGIVCTLTLYNFYYTRRYDQFFDNKNIRKMYHFVHIPSYVAPVNLPEVLKKKLDLPIFVEKFINSQKADPEQWKLFVEYTNHLDKIRNQSFSDTFPEFWEICKSHWF
jgi:sulfatase maturation enzyme AslB (radical SAM superfamily)